MASPAQTGLQIPPALREYFRYTGISATLERRGFGASRVENAWARRWPAHGLNGNEPARGPGNPSSSDR